MKRSLLALLTVVLAGCGGGSKKSASSSSSSGGGGGGLPEEPTAPPTVTQAAPLALQLFTKYDGLEAVNTLTFTETGTTSCSSTDSSPSATCTVVVPEGRLYFSSLNFQFSWMTSKCKLLTFVPYAYKASESPTYTPPGSGASVIDCSVTEPPATCYGGAGPTLIPTYPKDKAIIYLPDESKVDTPQSKIESLVSAFSKKWLSNRHTVNDLALAKRGTAFTSADLGGGGDEYIANTFLTYQWTCRDDWYDPETYTITLNVTEEDSESGAPVNHFRTWKEVP